MPRLPDLEEYKPLGIQPLPDISLEAESIEIPPVITLAALSTLEASIRMGCYTHMIQIAQIEKDFVSERARTNPAHFVDASNILDLETIIAKFEFEREVIEGELRQRQEAIATNIAEIQGLQPGEQVMLPAETKKSEVEDQSKKRQKKH